MEKTDVVSFSPISSRLSKVFLYLKSHCSKVHRVRLPVDSNTSVPLPYLQPFPYPVVYARPLPPVTYMRSEIPATYDSEEHRSATRRLSSPTPLERYSQCSAIKRVCTRMIGGCLSTVYPLYLGTLSETGVSEKEHSGMWWAQAPSQG